MFITFLFIIWHLQIEIFIDLLTACKLSLVLSVVGVDLTIFMYLYSLIWTCDILYFLRSFQKSTTSQSNNEYNREWTIIDLFVTYFLNEHQTKFYCYLPQFCCTDIYVVVFEEEKTLQWKYYCETVEIYCEIYYDKNIVDFIFPTFYYRDTVERKSTG